VKLVAVEGYSIQLITITGIGVQATVSDTGTPADKVIESGKKVLLDGHTLSVSAITDPGAGATIPDPGPYTATFNATSQKSKENGTLLLRVDDETDIINANPQIPGSPPVVYPVAFKFRIVSAGQTKVLTD
jgi:hypothetical protein